MPGSFFSSAAVSTLVRDEVSWAGGGGGAHRGGGKCPKGGAVAHVLDGRPRSALRALRWCSFTLRSILYRLDADIRLLLCSARGVGAMAGGRPACSQRPRRVGRAAVVPLTLGHHPPAPAATWRVARVACVIISRWPRTYVRRPPTSATHPY
jgi:hypothetical protein